MSKIEKYTKYMADSQNSQTALDKVWADHSAALNEGKLRLQGTYTNGDRTAKVYRDSEWEEHRVKFFKGGKHLTKADSHTSDKDDAHSTAKHWVGQADVKEGVEEHKTHEDHTKNPYHKILTAAGFQHVSTSHQQNRFAKSDPTADYTQHIYEKPSHDPAKPHRVKVEMSHATQSKSSNLKNPKSTWFHFFVQSNGLVAPSYANSKPSLQRTLDRNHGGIKEDVDLDEGLIDSARRGWKLARKYTGLQQRAITKKVDAAKTKHAKKVADSPYTPEKYERLSHFASIASDRAQADRRLVRYHQRGKKSGQITPETEKFMASSKQNQALSDRAFVASRQVSDKMYAMNQREFDLNRRGKFAAKPTFRNNPGYMGQNARRREETTGGMYRWRERGYWKAHGMPMHEENLDEGIMKTLTAPWRRHKLEKKLYGKFREFDKKWDETEDGYKKGLEQHDAAKEKWNKEIGDPWSKMMDTGSLVSRTDGYSAGKKYYDMARDMIPKGHKEIMDSYPKNPFKDPSSPVFKHMEAATNRSKWRSRYANVVLRKHNLLSGKKS